MKIDKLKKLQSELIKEFIIDGIFCEIYYHAKNNWHNLSGSPITNQATINSLDRSRRESIAYHFANSLMAWFYLPESNISISLKFNKSPRIGTRKKYRSLIEKIQESASNAYKVSHHPLTHLLAKDAFREELVRAISSLNEKDPPLVDTQESNPPRKLAVLALDIDYFKQVNDTWGHLYGDQVLKSFGKRLEDKGLEIEQSGSGNPSILTAHPSGEEFLVLIVANATREQFAIWADEFRSAISEEILPTAKEWQWLSECDDLSAITLPQIQDRTITTSIGVALHTTSASTSSTLDPSASFLDRADTALYRAKAAGRNQAIFYDEILSSCGRIIEQDENTGVIAIDIGSNVGVTVGQEFKVFNPKLSGNRKFSINDGRTTKTLGTYPRVESARIVVFNIQPEISFASIDLIDNPNVILEAGSILEAIPAGSIGHLLPHASKYFPSTVEQLRTGGTQSIQDFIKSATKTDIPFTIVVRFTREPEYLRKYGTAALNNSLAKLYRSAQTAFSNARGIEVLDRSSICIAGGSKSYNEKTTIEFVDRLADELPELGVLAGVFTKKDLEQFSKTNIMLDASNSLEFARFAASEFGRELDSRTRHFTPDTPGKALQALRDSRSFEMAYADYKRLVSLGIDSAEVLNLGGLIASNLGEIRSAFEHYQAATFKNPKYYIYKTNFGTTAYALNETEAGLEILNTLTQEETDLAQDRHTYGYITYTAMLAIAKSMKSPLFISSRFKKMAPIALELPEIKDLKHASFLIREAISEQ